MKIKEATNEDATHLMELELMLFKKWDNIDLIDKIDLSWFNSKEHKKETIEYLNDKSKKTLLVFVDNNCIGYLKAEIIKRSSFLKKVGYISEIYISDKFRGNKLGTKLLEIALNWFKEKKLEWTTVSTHSLDNEALNFWKNKGYVEYNKFLKMKI
jgi:ribosomal protein S18 acetylase RimI-like enzyme